MKSALVLLAAVVVLAGCELAPKISIHKAVETGNIDAVKKHLAAGTDVNADAESLVTPLTCGECVWEIGNLGTVNQQWRGCECADEGWPNTARFSQRTQKDQNRRTPPKTRSQDG